MRKLVLSSRFKRAFRKSVKRDPSLKNRIEATLEQIEKDVFASNLGTHKLSGILSGLWASSCGYDCRIIFSFEIDQDSGEEVILLLDIGTHDEIY